LVLILLSIMIKVCEILIEILQYNGLMSCISIKKWDGKEEYK
jgi:hypothetical protein